MTEGDRLLSVINDGGFARAQSFDICFNVDEQMLNDWFEDDIDTEACNMGHIYTQYKLGIIATKYFVMTLSLLS